MTRSGDEEAFITCGTTKGDITMHMIREWSPNGYDRAVELYERHFFDHSHFYRAVPKFLVQFGISYSKDKELVAFSKKPIQDDPKHDPPIEFHPGTISYAGSGPNSRGSQMFFSYGSAGSLGRELWETPIGKVISGMDAAEHFYSYGDMPPWGKGPVQGKIYSGPQYIEDNFPLIDKFLECTVERIGAGVAGSGSGSGSGDAGSGSGDEEHDSGDEEHDSGDDVDIVEGYLKKFDNDEKDVETGTGKVLDAKRRRGLVGLSSNKLAGGDSYQIFIFPALVILFVICILFSLLGRRKGNTKLN